MVRLELHVDELIELALDPAESGIHLRLEPGVGEFGVLSLFNDCRIDLVEPPIDLFEPPIDLFEPTIDLFEPLIDLAEPLIH